jgi:hypothetical protein
LCFSFDDNDDDHNLFNFIQLIIYLHAVLNSQWPSTESARIQTAAIRQNRTKQKQQKGTTEQTKMDQLKLFKLKHNLLKISVDLHTAFIADTHLTEQQWLKE